MGQPENDIDIETLIATEKAIVCKRSTKGRDMRDRWDEVAEAPDEDGPEWGA
ncbi:hypothetical protein ACFYVR_15785 [Rhodococcus sp. NPDC003318]|uniref:hypothetical protein n=1 Tax=Rhodococcus sp. NPDC003318 TaxID=3364503 RepID=UPI0036B3BD07